VREGKFRADLFYRLNVIPLALPPLRERREDVRELAEHFLRLYGPPGKELRLSEEFVERLEAHSWPGNVRELANCMRRVIALATSAEIGQEALEGPPWNEEKNIWRRLRCGAARQVKAKNARIAIACAPAFRSKIWSAVWCR